MVAVLCCGLGSFSQLLTWSPPFPTENNVSQTFVITMDANKGNKGLLNYTPATDVYVHTGVITNLSTSASDWRYVKFNQNFNAPNAQLQAIYIGSNKWQFTISGSLKTYYGVPAGETIRKIAILFRNGNGNAVQRNADNSDMYIPVYNSSPAVQFFAPALQPTYNRVTEQANFPIGSYAIKAYTTGATSYTLRVNGTTAFTGAVNTVGTSDSVVATVSFPAAGFYTLVAEVTGPSGGAADTLQLQIGTPTSPIAALPAGVQDGINYISSTSATLVLRAPNKGYATVIGEFNNWTPTLMNKTPDGKFFWTTLTGLTAGTEYAYQYVVDGNIKIADPYTEKVLDPNNDGGISSTTYPNLKAYPAGQSGMVSVLQPQAPAYTWVVNNYTQPDKRGLIIYELLLRDFVAAHDWKTLKDTLNYLKRLGVNAIEVMPFNEFEGNSSWGYNGYQYFAPDKYYGPKNSIKEFVDSAHKNGIAVIMDMVLNHTYGPSPLRDLYGLANNPWYNPTAPHASLNFGDDFNHESPDTKYFFGRVLKHWLTEYKLDGYRLDFTKGLTQKVTTTDAALSAYDASRIAIIKGYADSARKANAAAYMILEHFCDNTEEKELSDYDLMLWASVWTQYQEASMGYLGNSNFDQGLYTTKGWTKPGLVTFMESHDEERVTFKNIKYGNSSGSYNVKDTATALKRMELNAAFLLTIPGPKMIWEFGELGYDYSRCYLATNGDGGDCNTKLDPKPIRWDYKTDARRKAVYDVYAGLNRLRFDSRYAGAFQSGAIDRSLGGAFKWIKVTTTGDTADLVVIGNFDVTATTGTVTFPTSGTWYDYFGNFIHSSTGSAQSFTLQPGEYHVYVNRNVNNLSVTPVNNVPWNGTTLEVKAYPNPVTAGLIYLELKMPQAGKPVVELYSSTGQTLAKLYDGSVAAGTKVLTLPAPQLAAGTYFLKVQAAGYTKTVSISITTK